MQRLFPTVAVLGAAMIGYVAGNATRPHEPSVPSVGAGRNRKQPGVRWRRRRTHADA